MEHDNHHKKLEFLHKIAKLGMQHFDGGGLVGGLGSALGVSNSFTPQGTPTQQQLQDSLNQSNAGISAAQNLSTQTSGAIPTALTNQNALASQLLAMSQGQGPNPALAQLNQATGANTANQAALMAGQRGSSNNVGLIARQAAQQGAANQQNAIGNAATLQAQQQINAQNNLANLSAQQVGQAGQAVGLYNNATGNQLGTLENANAAYNTTASDIGKQNAATNSGLLGQALGGASSVLGGGAFGLAKGGEVPARMAEGGLTSPAVAAPAPTSWVGNYLSSSGPMAATAPTPDAQPAKSSSPVDSLMKLAPLALAANGGDIRQYANSGDVVEAETPHEEATKPGNSYDNDKIPAMLSEGEVVIDRNTLADPGPVGQMARALRAHIEARNKRKSD